MRCCCWVCFVLTEKRKKTSVDFGALLYLSPSLSLSLALLFLCLIHVNGEMLRAEV